MPNTATNNCKKFELENITVLILKVRNVYHLFSKTNEIQQFYSTIYCIGK